MDAIDNVFAGCAIVGGALFFVRLVLFFFGGGAEADGDFDVSDMDLDVDADVGDFDGDTSDSDVSFRVLSLQTTTAFFMMFGLAGLALRKAAQMQVPGSLLGAVIAGGFAVWVIAKIMSMMMRLQSSGTINMAAAVGQEGAVYLTIPEGSMGKVQLTVDGRFRVMDAICQDGQVVSTGERVTVVGVNEDNTLVVTKLQ